MSNRLAALSRDRDARIHGRPRLLPSHPLVQAFVNKLFLMRITDIPYMNLTGDDIDPNRDHVFHVTCPPAWKTQDVIHLFGPFGNVFVSWLDDTSCLVALNQKDNAPHVIPNLNNSGGLYRIKTYRQFKTCVGTTGITPQIEEVNFSFAEPTRSSRNGDHGGRKRSVSPSAPPEQLKRTKSLSEGAKPKTAAVFEEPTNWD